MKLLKIYFVRAIRKIDLTLKPKCIMLISALKTKFFDSLREKMNKLVFVIIVQLILYKVAFSLKTEAVNILLVCLVAILMKIADRVNVNIFYYYQISDQNLGHQINQFIIISFMPFYPIQFIPFYIFGATNYLWRHKLFANNAQTLYIKKEFDKTTPKI